MRSAITLSLVPEARGGPFVFWDDLPRAIAETKRLGFDAIEIFAPSADALRRAEMSQRLRDASLPLAALGTGAGWVLHQLTLSHLDAAVRQKAIDFIRPLIDLAGEHGASAIIGSMQGRAPTKVQVPDTMSRLIDCVAGLADHAAQYRVPLLLEPLNRYETNLLNTVESGRAALAGVPNARLLCDLFHMNIEEVDIAASLRLAGDRLGHVHFVDSNRRPPLLGHLDFCPIFAALHSISFDGYLSAEAIAHPDPDAAAAQTVRAYRQLTQGIASC